MKIQHNYLRIAVFAAVFGVFALFNSVAHAASIPNLSVTSIGGTSGVQITVTGADSYASVQFNYPSSSGSGSLGIGTTDSNGYFTTSISASSYQIPPNVAVYVVVDGQSSASVQMPNYTGASSGAITLSQSSVSLPIGQSVTVTASVSDGLSVSNDSNPSVASAVISGSQINITAYNTGTTNITVCATGLSCSTLYVTVQSSSGSGSPSVFFSQSNVTVGVNQTQTVAVTGTGSFYLSGNTNATIASASLNGSTLTINGLTDGNDSVSICSLLNGINACSSVNITVSDSGSVTSNSSTGTLSFSQTTTNLSVGQNQSVSIYNASAPYYISSNSSQSVVAAAINSTSVSLTGLAAGQSSITVCSSSGQCGTMYVYVTSNGTTVTSTTGNTGQIPAIASFTVSSNDANNNFMGFGSVLTFSFTTNQSINAEQMTANGTNLTVSGVGTGPYTASYTMTGAEPSPLPVTVQFSNANGTSNKMYFSAGNAAAVSTAAASTVSTVGASVVFDQYLYVSSTGAEVSALQRRLTADGLYTGPITGTFGGLTQAAVKAYQAKHGLDTLGVVGPATRTLLNQGI